jgi:PAS domain S-box-containing protein
MSTESEIEKEMSKEEKLAGISNSTQHKRPIDQITKDSSGTVLDVTSNINRNSMDVLDNTQNSKNGKNTESSKDLSEKYRLIALNTSDLISFITCAADPIFTFVSPSYKKILGFEAEDLLGKPWLDFIYQDDKQQIRKIIIRYLDAKINGILTVDMVKEVQKLVFRIRDKSGQWHFLRSTISIVDDEFLFISRDITEPKHAEETFHQSEEIFSKVFRLSPESITLTSLNQGRYIDVNESFLRMTGYSHDEVIGRNASELSIWVDPNDRVKFIQGLKEQGFIRNLEVRMRKKSGDVGIVLMSSEIITINGEPCAITVTTNITHRKHNEEILRENDQKMKAIIQGLSIAAFIIDSNHQVLYWNKAMEQLSNIHAEEIIGTTNQWRAFYPQKRPCMADILLDGGPEDIEKWYAEKYNKSSLLDESYEVIDFFSNLGPDGKWLRLTVTVIRDTSGNLIGALETIEDISDRKKEEDALKESEERYKILFDAALDGICLADVETGLIVDCNQALADIVGRERTALIGQSQTILHPPNKDQVSFSPTFRQHLTTDEGKTLETQVVTRIGIIRDVEIKANRLNLKGRKMLHGIFRDITEKKKAEDALRRSEEQYRLVTENASDVIWTMDMNLRFTYISPSHEKLTGYSTEQALTLALSELLTPESMEHAVQTFTAEIQLENSKEKDLSRSVTLELYERRADGKIFPVEVRMSFLRDAHHNPIGILGITRDITERKNAEKQLRKSEERFRKLFDSSPDLIIETDENGNILAVNPTMAESMGVPSDKLIGKNIFNIFPKEVAEERAKIARKALEEMKNQESEDERAGRYFQNIYVPIISPDGKKTIQLIARDITVEKKAKDALQESEEKYRSIVENTQDVIMLTNPDGRVSYISPACMNVLGYNPDDLVGKIPEIFYSDDIQKVHNALTSAMQGVNGSNLEYRILTKVGEIRWVSHSWSSILTEDRTLKYIVSVVRNITDSKNAMQNLKAKIEELEKYKNVTVNREVKMVDLKKEINELCKQMNREPKYPNI